MSEKKCGRCKTVKPLSDFAACKSAKDGKQNRCKACDREVRIPYYQKCREETAARELAERTAKALSTEKTCPRCKCLKPLTDFHRRRTNADGHTGWCKECKAVAGRKRYLENQEKRCSTTQAYYKAHPIWARGHRIRKFWPGSTWEEVNDKYESILKSQNDCCQICQRHRSEFPKYMDIDHNHVTGQVRGIICNDCNHALGLLKADIGLDYLRRAVTYIEQYQESEDYVGPNFRE
jgi:hypothetical protein